MATMHIANKELSLLFLPTDTHSLPPGDGVDLRNLYRLPAADSNQFHGIPSPDPLFLGCRRFGLTCFAGQAQQGQLLFL